MKRREQKSREFVTDPNKLLVQENLRLKSTTIVSLF